MSELVREPAILVSELTPLVIRKVAQQNKITDKKALESAVKPILALFLREFQRVSTFPNRDASYADVINNGAILKLGITLDDKTVRSLINQGIKKLSSVIGDSSVADQALKERLAQQVALRQSLKVPSFNPLGPVPPKSEEKTTSSSSSMGGAGSKPKSSKKGGDLIPNVETKTYVPETARVTEIQRTEGPCLFEQRMNEDGGFYMFTPQRYEKAGVQKLTLSHINKKDNVVVPRNCINEYVKILNNVQVEQTTMKDSETNKDVYTQFKVTPQFDTYSQTRLTGTRGPEIPFERLQEVGKETESTSAINIGPILTVGGQSQQKKKGGNSLKQAGLTLPDQKAAARKAYALNDQDLSEYELNLPKNINKLPEGWEKLTPPDADGSISYLRGDSYGTVSIKSREVGFPFQEARMGKHMPYSLLTASQKKYLEYLLGVDYELRSSYPTDHFHKFDPVFSTIATVETYILTTIGKLESKKVIFDTAKIFKGGESFKNMMSQTLRVYALEYADRKVKVSPLSNRYTDMSKSDLKNEIDTYDNLVSFYESVKRSIDTDFKNSSGVNVKLPVEMKTINQIYNALGTTENDQKFKIMAVVEDELLAALARLQFLGYVINTSNVSFQSSNSLTDPLQRAYLRPETTSYIEDFRFIEPDQVEKVFYRIPKLRRAVIEDITTVKTTPLVQFPSLESVPVDWSALVSKGKSKSRSRTSSRK